MLDWWTIRAILSHYYHWSHDETGRLTQRQAQGYYRRIGDVEKQFGRGESEEDKGVDIDTLFDDEEAARYSIKPPGA